MFPGRTVRITLAFAALSLLLIAAAANAKIKYIYVVPTSHWNLGGNDWVEPFHFPLTPEIAKQSYKEHLDRVLEACLKHPDLFWTIEALWQFEAWWERTPQPKARQAMLRLLREGRISLSAVSHNYRSAFLGAEEVNRVCYSAQRLREVHGLTLQTAVMNDVPGWNWSLVQALAKSGVRYFLAGPNYFMGGQLSIPPKDLPFFWQGPDGSRLLTWVCIGGYTEGQTRVFVDPNGGRFFAWLGVVNRPELVNMNNEQVMELSLHEELARLQSAGYPYDAILIMHAHDGIGPDNILSAMPDIRAWNARHKYPQIIISTPEHFFRHLEKKYGDRFPVYSGDWAGLWESAHFPEPHLRAMLKYARDHAPALEKVASLSSLLGAAPYPHFDLARINELMLENDDQGAGGAASQVSAYQFTKGLYLFSLTRLASQIATQQPAIVVFNPSSWARTDWVISPLKPSLYETEFLPVDAKTNAPVPYEKLPDHQVGFLAREVPSLGYRLYFLQPGKSPQAGSLSASENTIENEFYRLRADPGSGAITSIYDKELGRELVEENPSFPFNSLLISDRPLWGGLEADSVGRVVISTSADKVVARLTIERQGTAFSKSEILLYAGLKRLHLRNWLDWLPRERQPGSCYFYFPFALKPESFIPHMENANAFLSPATTYLPGAYSGSFIASRAIDLHEGDLWGIAVAQRQTEIIFFDQGRPALVSKILTSEAGNDAGVTPPSEILYEYCFTSYSGPFNPTQVKHFGEAAAIPLWADWLSPPEFWSRPGPLDKPELSFLHISPPNVLLSAWKPAQRGDGSEYLLRFQEVAGEKKTEVVVNSRFAIERAEVVDMVKRPLPGGRLATDPLRFTLGPYETLSIRARLSPFSR